MNTSTLVDQRRELRNHSTEAEVTLWKMLKDKQICNLKFRRQHSVGPYILDFYCSQICLAIELDGEIHNRQQDYDEQRTLFLNKVKGIEVLRFENRVVFENPELIVGEIEDRKLSFVDLPTTSPFGYSSSQEGENLR
ncbi:MAG: endonuclease domain-containing protein [Bacteroides sp.]|nr:endonuclease domain-containing protein [Bacteroides sp.]